MRKEPPAERHSAGAFRTSALQYAVGRGVNALLSLSLFLWLARALPAEQYASYVVLVAVLEILLVAANLGMDWVTAIQVPKLHQAGAARALTRFIARCLAAQTLALVLVAAAVALGANQAARMLGIADAADLLRWYAAVLCAEGLSRAVRDQVLASLLLQWASQVAQTVRNLLVMTVLLAIHWAPLELQLQWVLQAELAASLASLAIGVWLMCRHLRAERSHSAADPDIAPPSLRELRRMALNAWVASLTQLVWGGQVVVLLVSRMLGAEAAGLVGFARNLAEQVRKLMPLEFLFNLVRTFLVSRHASEQDREVLLGRIALFIKINMLAVVPLILCGVRFGEEICDLLSAGRYGQAHWVLAGWLVWVLLWSHHRLADALAHLMGRSAIIGRVGLCLLVMPLVYASMLAMGGVPALFVALVAGEAVYVFWVVRGAVTGLVRYPWRVLALPKMMLAASVSLGTSSALQSAWPRLPLSLGVLVLAGSFALAILVLRPWSASELQWVRGRAT